MLNINFGRNRELLEKCKTLREYSVYVERVRKYAKQMPVDDAVRRAVDECIKEDVLSRFLLSQKAEVIAMSIFEYDEEAEMVKIRRGEFELGREAGALEKLIQQTCKKLQKGKNAEQIAEELEESPALIARICHAAGPFAPDYDSGRIAEALSGSDVF